MLKKYNIAVNIAFWIVVGGIIVIFSLSLFMPGLKINSYLFGTQKEVVIEKEPVVVTEVREIEKNIEWYYFVATGYSKNDSGQGTGSITATGKSVAEGIIAVDPEMIPYGTVVEIKDIGIFTAEDCGSKIKGNRLDIYFDSREDAKEFGRQGVWIRFVNGTADTANIEIALAAKP
jgi:3D (Asp-Asp-Asp) domain-containing protein